MTKEKKAERYRHIFPSSPYTFEILQILDSKGPLSYSELKTLADIKPEKSSKFAYSLQKLIPQELVSRNRTKRHYVCTNVGRIILNITTKLLEGQEKSDVKSVFLVSSSVLQYY